MANCVNDSSNFLGQTLAIEWVAGCGDDDPATLSYKPLGTINSKSLDDTVNTTSNRSDLSGADDSVLATYRSGSITVGGFMTKTDNAQSSQAELIVYGNTEIDNARQPTVWLKVSGPSYPFVEYRFCQYLGRSTTGNTDETVGIEFTFQSTSRNNGQPSLVVVPV